MPGGAQMILSLIASFAAMGLVSNWETAMGWMDAHQGVAGFAQFLGGVLAIGGAYMIGNMQTRTARQIEVGRQRFSDNRMLTLTEAILSDVRTRCDEIFDTWVGRGHPPIEGRIRELQECIDVAKRIDPFQCAIPSVAIGVAQLPAMIADLIDDIHIHASAYPSGLQERATPQQQMEIAFETLIETLTELEKDCAAAAASIPHD